MSDHNCGTEFYDGEVVKSKTGRAIVFPSSITIGLFLFISATVSFRKGIFLNLLPVKLTGSILYYNLPLSKTQSVILKL